MMKRWKGRLNIDHKINQFEDKPAAETKFMHTKKKKKKIL